MPGRVGSGIPEMPSAPPVTEALVIQLMKPSARPSVTIPR